MEEGRSKIRRGNTKKSGKGCGDSRNPDLHFETVLNMDPASPYHFESVTLVIASGENSNTSRNKASSSDCTETNPSSLQQLTDLEQGPAAAAATLLKWLHDIIGLCKTREGILHADVRRYVVNVICKMMIMMFTASAGRRNEDYITAITKLGSYGQHETSPDISKHPFTVSGVG